MTDDRAASATRVERIACEMAGCPHVMDYVGVGRKPKYCGQVVDGVAHTRLTAQKIRDGRLVLPAAGTRVDAVPRPVSLAKASIEALRDEITATIGGHQDWLAQTLARVEDAFATATDPDAATAEVTAAHRESRARIDTAETAAEDALTRARAAEAARTAAETGQRDAEVAAEAALTDRDDALEARDRLTAQVNEQTTELGALRARLADAEHAHQRAASERDQLADQYAGAVTDRDQHASDLTQLRDAHATLRAEHQQAESERDTARDDLAAARAELAVAREDAAEQRHRAETADRVGAELRDDLTAARARADEHAADAAQARTAQAVAAAENTALARQLERDLDRERAHAEQRLTDLRERQIQELRAAERRMTREPEHVDPAHDANTAPGRAPARRDPDAKAPRRTRPRTGQGPEPNPED